MSVKPAKRTGRPPMKGGRKEVKETQKDTQAQATKTARRAEIRNLYIATKEESPESARMRKMMLGADSTFAERLVAARTRDDLDMAQETLGKLLGGSRSAVAQWERGASIPPIPVLMEVARILKVTPQWLAFGLTDDETPAAKTDVDPDFVTIEERVYDGLESYRKTASWGVPRARMVHEARAADPESLFLIRVEADNMSPKYAHGDMILIDPIARKVSPPGIFAHWDGVGISVNQIAVIPGPVPVARVSSLDGTPQYEVDPEKLTILGRVRGSWRFA